MKTVKEAFEKAYGPLPEGATCYFCWVNSDSGDTEWGQSVIEFPMPKSEGRDRGMWAWSSADEEWIDLFEECEDPLPGTGDLSKNPPQCYENFADYRYDKVVSE